MDFKRNDFCFLSLTDIRGDNFYIPYSARLSFHLFRTSDQPSHLIGKYPGTDCSNLDIASEQIVLKLAAIPVLEDFERSLIPPVLTPGVHSQPIFGLVFHSVAYHLDGNVTQAFAVHVVVDACGK